jgi:lysozyme
MTTKEVVKELVKTNLTKNQTAAIESFVSDRGIEIFKNSSLLKALNRNDLAAVPAELARWIVHNGRRDYSLVTLREQEIALFTK